MIRASSSILYFLILVVILGACKASRTPSSSDKYKKAPVDSVVIKQGTPKIKADTLIIRVQDSVELAVHRLIKDTLTVIGVGDIMMGTNFPNTSYLPPNRGKDLLSEVDSILRDADVTFGNLEGVILDKGGNAKYCKNPKICYIFRSPEYMVQNLVDAGFDVMSTANNHAGDFGNSGRKNTMKVLDSMNIVHAGLMSKPFDMFMRDGMKYGFAAFAPNTGTMSINDIAKAKEIVAHLDSLNDVVIVSFHGGAEGNKYQRVTRKNEYFYGENRGNVYKFAHEMVDAGADIIFGHGPHVTRAVEVYKDRFISYSLGNFCTYGRFNIRGVNGLAPIVKVFTDGSGKFFRAQVTPIIQLGRGEPKLDGKKRVITKIRELTEKDFPEVKINIDDSGIITYIKE